MRRFFLFAGLTLSPFCAWASMDNPMQFALAKDCAQGECTPVGVGIGTIQDGSQYALRDFVHAYPEVNKIYWHSPGGDLMVGLQMGVYLRKQGMDSAVAPRMKCFSACAYTFLGGSTRTVEEGGVIGVHRFYSMDGRGGLGEGQQMQSLLTRYTRDMGVSETLVELSSQAGADEMVGIGAARAKALRVDNASPTPSAWGLTPHKGKLMASTRGYALGWDSPTTLVIENNPKQDDNHVVARLNAPKIKGYKPTRLSGADLKLCTKAKGCLSATPIGDWYQDTNKDWVGIFKLKSSVLQRLLETQADGVLMAAIVMDNGRIVRMPTDLSGLRTIIENTRG